LDPKDTNSLGMQLIYNLTEQLRGKIEINRDHGTKIIIKFKEVKYNTY
jgi:two-component sensor histidine kinase